MSNSHPRRCAERVRAACIQAALEGYEAAAISGLCHEGAWEAAIDAMRMLDIDMLAAQGDDDAPDAGQKGL